MLFLFCLTSFFTSEEFTESDNLTTESTSTSTCEAPNSEAPKTATEAPKSSSKLWIILLGTILPLLGGAFSALYMWLCHNKEDSSSFSMEIL
jgi:hypothetical protein